LILAINLQVHEVMADQGDTTVFSDVDIPFHLPQETVMPPSPVKPATIDAYLAALPADRREALAALRAVINRNLPKGYEEGMQYGMPAWFVPHSAYPAGYHCDPRQPLPFVSIASQKSHIGLYFFCLYMNPELMSWFEAEWRKTGSRWDAGKSCVRAKKLADIPIDLVGKVVKKVPMNSFIAGYEAALPASAPRKSAAVKGAATTGAKKAATKSTTSRVSTASSKKASSKKTTSKKPRRS
jgi:hypothetical protein